MMAFLNPTFISAYLIILLFGCAESEAPNILKFNEVTNKFAWNLYKEVKQPSENTILSPISLQLLLDILLQGANGTTAAEIARVLQHEADDKTILNAYKNFLEDLDHKDKTTEFKTATAIAVDQSFPLSEVDRMNQHLNQYFKTDIKKYDFKENPKNSSDMINAWVKDHTEGEIETLLPEGSIDSSTEMVMVSGTVFKGEWKHKFNKKNTVVERFHITRNESRSVNMMGLTGGRFRYLWNSDHELQIVELPYKEKEFRMIIILPDNGLAELERKFTYEDLSELINSIKETSVDVFLPRFKIKKSVDLVNGLKKMGMLTAFSRYADFSKMTNSSISVSKVMQKAMIVVKEKGTRAAAGSGITLTAKALPPQMVCNSPFLYIIFKGDTILFIGSFLKPPHKINR
ncbi:unnamed protein product [Nezara viridula]|uniref:Serpin domain-containing protein n=1 Tax=Nezara viridula TaxID=85310 RepID=A0A9P0H802_NEZVI|nr:unnamed protein product [Nezara viridula]